MSTHRQFSGEYTKSPPQAVAEATHTGFPDMAD
jgi:hypothetical protein